MILRHLNIYILNLYLTFSFYYACYLKRGIFPEILTINPYRSIHDFLKFTEFTVIKYFQFLLNSISNLFIPVNIRVEEVKSNNHQLNDIIMTIYITIQDLIQRSTFLIYIYYFFMNITRLKVNIYIDKFKSGIIHLIVFFI